MFVRQAGGRHPQPAAGPKLWRTPTAHDRRAWAAGRGPRSTSKMIQACREGDDAHAQAAHDAALGAVPQAPPEVGWARVALSRRVPARRAALRAWARPRAWIPGTSPGPQANSPQRALGRSTGPRSRDPDRIRDHSRIRRGIRASQRRLAGSRNGRGRRAPLHRSRSGIAKVLPRRRSGRAVSPSALPIA